MLCVSLNRSFVLFLSCFALNATAAEYYVSTTGSNTNAGTFAQPWRTIQKAASTVVAGDVVNIRAGTYAERVTIHGLDGTATLPILFQRYPADSGAVLIDQTGVTPPNGTSAIFTIQNSDHIVLKDLEIANYKTSGTAAQQRAQLPIGLYLVGDGAGIRILNCKVHDIWQSSTTLNHYDANAFGIAVYGTSANAIDQLIIDGCEVYGLRTGASESVVLNGNVTNFRVTNNKVHDCNNIGIDFIGFEGANATAALDQARDGVCSGNVIYKIDSKFNPVYGGNFTTGGNNGTRAAPGLYVDGGKNIVFERNHVYDCNFAISVGSENTGKVVTNIIVRNNIFNHCHVGGVVIGGSDSSNGGADRCVFSNNTLYANDSTASGGGQIMIQHYVTNTTIQRNIIASTASFAQLVLKDNTTGSFAANSIDWNLYKVNAGADIELIWDGSAFSSFASWKTAGSLAKDAHSTWITTSLGLANSSPTSPSPAADFALTESSPARDAGDSASLPFTPALGEKDYFGDSRVANGRVDIGADEFLSPLQSWRDFHFSSPENTGVAADLADPDRDGVSNLLEYSQGMNPKIADLQLLPSLSKVGDSIQYTYRKYAPELTYLLQQSQNLSTWVPSTLPETNLGNGYFSVTLPSAPAPQFVRLKVTRP